MEVVNKRPSQFSCSALSASGLRRAGAAQSRKHQAKPRLRRCALRASGCPRIVHCSPPSSLSLPPSLLLSSLSSTCWPLLVHSYYTSLLAITSSAHSHRPHQLDVVALRRPHPNLSDAAAARAPRKLPALLPLEPRLLPRVVPFLEPLLVKLPKLGPRDSGLCELWLQWW